MKLYQILLTQIHPQFSKNFSLSTEEVNSRLALLEQFKDNDEVLKSLASSWGIKAKANKSSFQFPYPDVEFRVSDIVSYEGILYIIDSITRIKDGWKFVLKEINNEKNIKKIKKDSLNSGRDENFYLYEIRKDTEKQIQF